MGGASPGGEQGAAQFQGGYPGRGQSGHPAQGQGGYPAQGGFQGQSQRAPPPGWPPHGAQVAAMPYPPPYPPPGQSPDHPQTGCLPPQAGYAPYGAPLPGQYPYPAGHGQPAWGAPMMGGQMPWSAAPPYWPPPHQAPAGGWSGMAGAHGHHAAPAQPAAGDGGLTGLLSELAGGGNGLGSLTRMLSLDDKEMWKGALIGAAAVLLLTNDSVQNALFRGGVRARDALADGVDRVKTGLHAAKVRETADE